MKIAIRRGAKAGAESSVGSDSGTASAVLDAPEEMYAPETEAATERVTSWPGGGPAPAGALQRGFGPDDFSGDSTPAQEEAAPYVPRRGAAGSRWRGLPRSLGGRIVLGCVAFGMLSAVGLAIAGGRYFLLHDDRFLVAGSSQIEVDGNAHLTRAQVLSVFAGDLERNIFRMSLAERRADLGRLPWVQHATVMRLLPDHIRVSITERTPVAFVKQGTELGLVDAGGVLLDMPPQDAGDPRYSFPVLTGIAPTDELAVRASRMAVYRQFMQELDGSGNGGGGEKLSAQVSEVDVSNPEDVKALVASGGMDILVHFGHEQFLARFKEFEQHLAEWKQQYPKLASADMRYEGQVVLEMQQGAPVPVNGDGSAATASDAPAAPAAVPATAKPAAAAVSPAAHGGKPKPKPAKKVVAKKAAPVKAAAKKKNVELVTP